MQIFRMLFLALLFVLTGAVGILYTISDAHYATREEEALGKAQQSLAEGKFEDAYRWFEQSAYGGVLEAQYEMARMLQHGQGTAPDKQAAAKWFGIAAKNGDTRASFELARMLESGDGIDANPAQAFAFYQKAGEHGHTAAQQRLALLAVDGIGSKQSDAEALRWMLQATGKKDAASATFAALMADKFRAGVDAGRADAMVALAELYRTGIGVAPDAAARVALLERAAALDHAGAQLDLGRTYLEGELRDPKKGAFWLERAASTSVEAQSRLGALYALGIGLSADSGKARQWLSRAAEAGDAHAQFNLSVLLLEENDGNSDALKWLESAVGQGYAPAMTNLGAMLLVGSGMPANPKRGTELLRQAARSDALAQYDLGLATARGIGMAANFEMAIGWLKRAESNGAPTARRLLGLLYDLGYGVDRNPAEAARWYGLAVEKGDADALFNLALLNYRQEKFKEAASLFERGANAGDAAARNNLAALYQSGRGVAFDQAMALNHYQQAAKGGSPEAAFNLGNLYRRGDSVAQSDAVACDWYRKAAAANLAAAQNAMGYMLAMGRGVKKDNKEALRWLNLAAAANDELAKKNIPLLQAGKGGLNLSGELVADEIRSPMLTQTNYNPADWIERYRQPIL